MFMTIQSSDGQIVNFILKGSTQGACHVWEVTWPGKCGASFLLWIALSCCAFGLRSANRPLLSSRPTRFGSTLLSALCRVRAKGHARTVAPEPQCLPEPFRTVSTTTQYFFFFLFFFSTPFRDQPLWSLVFSDGAVTFISRRCVDLHSFCSRLSQVAVVKTALPVQIFKKIKHIVENVFKLNRVWTGWN